MTISLIKGLLTGNKDLPEQMEKANDFWKDFFEKHSADADAELAKALGDGQSKFEWDIFSGNRGDAKELMPLTALGYLYDEANGFDDPDFAARVALAFENSFVSTEVKSYAVEAAAIFHLGDHNDVLRDRITKRYNWR